MTPTPRFGQDEATVDQIAGHLRACADDFAPPLTGRVDIDEYARKIESRATRFEAWADDRLVGLVAVYANDATGELAYVTSVSVAPEDGGHGVGTTLLTNAIESMRRRGFRRMALEVEQGNVVAVRLYTRVGFVVTEAQGRMARMDLELRAPSTAEVDA